MTWNLGTLPQYLKPGILDFWVALPEISVKTSKGRVSNNDLIFMKSDDLVKRLTPNDLGTEAVTLYKSDPYLEVYNCVGDPVSKPKLMDTGIILRSSIGGPGDRLRTCVPSRMTTIPSFHKQFNNNTLSFQLERDRG
jgi:hypothetical protein